MTLDRTTDESALPADPTRPRDPTFICIGSQKAGTGTLYDMLRGHRQVWMPPIKELHFFDDPYDPHRRARLERKLARIVRRRSANQKGANRQVDFMRRYLAMQDEEDATLECYRDLFGFAGEEVTGDVTPGYSVLDTETVERLSNVLPDVRILLTLRDPLARVWSQARMEARAFGDEVVTSPAAFKRFVQQRYVVDRSLQSVFLKRWQRAFGGRFKVMFFDDLVETPQAFFADVCNFIGIDPDPAATRFRLGENSKDFGRLPMSPEIRRIAIEAFGAEYDRLVDLVGGHAADWRETARGARPDRR